MTKIQELRSAPLRVLAISGSLRRDSLNTALLLTATRLVPPSVHIELETGIGTLPMFNEDIEVAAFHEGPLRAFARRVADADALLIATPEYNHSFPAALKNAVDWLSRPGAHQALVDKPVAVIGASGGRWGTRLAQAALRQVLFACEARVLTGPALYVANGNARFTGPELAADESDALCEVIGGLATLANRQR